MDRYANTWFQFILFRNICIDLPTHICLIAASLNIKICRTTENSLPIVQPGVRQNIKMKIYEVRPLGDRTIVNCGPW